MQFSKNCYKSKLQQIAENNTQRQKVTRHFKSMEATWHLSLGVRKNTSYGSKFFNNLPDLEKLHLCLAFDVQQYTVRSCSAQELTKQSFCKWPKEDKITYVLVKFFAFQSHSAQKCENVSVRAHTHTHCVYEISKFMWKMLALFSSMKMILNCDKFNKIIISH